MILLLPGHAGGEGVIEILVFMFLIEIHGLFFSECKLLLKGHFKPSFINLLQYGLCSKSSYVYL